MDLNEPIYRGIARLLPMLDVGFGVPFGHLPTCLKSLKSRGFEPASMIDVGANRGKWSRDFLKVFPDCAALLIEPQQELTPHLDRLCAGQKKCRRMITAVSDFVGEKIFTVSPDTYSSGFWPSEEYAKEQGLERRVVPVTTLNALVEGAAVPDVVKIDAEAHELTILTKADKLLGKTELFFVEANFFGAEGNSFVDLIKFMDGHHYAPYDFTWFYQRPRDRALMLCEVVFVLRTSKLRASLSWT